MNKTIVVLANSMKRGGRCLAGKELIPRGQGWEIGSWIRPVATESSGAVPVYPMQRALGHLPRLLEIIEISLVKPVPLLDQPENWLIEMPMNPHSWRSVGSFRWDGINQLLDNPEQLWHDVANPRRVPVGYPQKMVKPASLFLFKPERIVSISAWSEPNHFEPANPVKKHRQAILRYAGMTHEFDIDDIDFADKYYSQFPGVGDPAIHVKLRNPTATIVCASLTREFHGHHYKIAAAFFEPPE